MWWSGSCSGVAHVVEVARGGVAHVVEWLM